MVHWGTFTPQACTSLAKVARSGCFADRGWLEAGDVSASTLTSAVCVCVCVCVVRGWVGGWVGVGVGVGVCVSVCLCVCVFMCGLF